MQAQQSGSRSTKANVQHADDPMEITSKSSANLKKESKKPLAFGAERTSSHCRCAGHMHSRVSDPMRSAYDIINIITITYATALTVNGRAALCLKEVMAWGR